MIRLARSAPNRNAIFMRPAWADMRQTARHRALAGSMLHLIRRRPRGTARLGTTAACLCLAAYGASPYVALWSINTAIHAKDASILSSHVDWSALDGSLKTDAIATLAGPPPAADDLPDFGTSFESTAVSHAIDTHMNAQSLLDMADRVMPAGTAAPTYATFAHMQARFVAPARFEARMQVAERQTPLIVHLRFVHWHWKITRFEMPTSVPTTVADATLPTHG